MADEAKPILDLFEQIALREDDIKELREEIKDAIDLFCEEYDAYEKKAVKTGYKFFKQLAKDKSSTVDEEFQRDKIVELLIGSKQEEI